MRFDFKCLHQAKENLRVSWVAELDGLTIELEHPQGGVDVTPLVVVGFDSSGLHLQLQLQELVAH